MCFDPRLRGGGDGMIPARAADSSRFRSTPPRGRRRQALPGRPIGRRFDPRLRGGGDAGRKSAWSGHRSFDPRLRGGGDALSRVIRDTQRVSIHASAGEATGAARPVRPSPDCFDPRLRGGGDLNATAMRQAADVSIHASAGEATTCTMQERDLPRVSIHASAGEATRCHRRLQSGGTVSIHASAGEATSDGGAANPEMFQFRSTPPRGRRLHYLLLWPIRQCFDPRLRGGGDNIFANDDMLRHVSIHASAGEATRPTQPLEGLIQCFDPRLRGGGDARLPAKPVRWSSFDPRLHGGGDRLAIHFAMQPTCFDPRLRGGGDCRRRWLRLGFAGFDPRLRGGGDFCPDFATSPVVLFRSTPPRGRRPPFGMMAANRGKFRSTPPRGRRRGTASARIRSARFDPRLRGGGDGKVAAFAG